MPRPIPDYVPAEIVDLMAKHGWSNFVAMSKETDIPKSTLYSMFLKPKFHHLFLNWHRWSEALEMKIETLVYLYENDLKTLRSRIDAKFNASIPEFARKSGCHYDTTRKLYRGQVSTEVVHRYMNVASTFGIETSELGKILVPAIH